MENDPKVKLGDVTTVNFTIAKVINKVICIHCSSIIIIYTRYREVFKLT